MIIFMLCFLQWYSHGDNAILFVKIICGYLKAEVAEVIKFDSLQTFYRAIFHTLRLMLRICNPKFVTEQKKV